MQVREFVSIIEEYNPDYSREAIREEINYVQREVFASRLNFNKAYDPVTGGDIQITPTQVEHVIADAQSIDRVYSSDYSYPMNLHIFGNTIIFKESDLNTPYYVSYYKAPTEYTSESQTLFIPDQFISILEDGVNARIQFKQHGQLDVWTNWKKYELPNLRRKLNKNYKWQ